jgi:hypothetical protein
VTEAMVPFKAIDHLDANKVHGVNGVVHAAQMVAEDQ